MTLTANEQRADRAYRVALIYAHDQDHEDIEAAIIDLTTDLLLTASSRTTYSASRSAETEATQKT